MKVGYAGNGGGMFVDVSHGRLFCEVVECRGPSARPPGTVMFLHGVAATHRMWANWIDVLAPSCRLVLIDTRGCGQSGDIGNLEDWSLDDFSDDVLAAADAVGAGDIHLIGESFGGTAVLNLAARALPRVKSATVLSTAHRGGQIEKVKAWRRSIEENGLEEWSRQMMERRFFPGAISAEDHDWFHRIQASSPPLPLLRMGEMLLGTDLTERLSNISCPLLMISPDHSPFVTPDIPMEILSAVPEADLAVLPHTRHGIFFSHGEECARLWLEFQERLDLP